MRQEEFASIGMPHASRLFLLTKLTTPYLGLLGGRGLWSPTTTGILIGLDRLNRRKLPVYVWFCAQSARVQQTGLPRSDTARRTGHGVPLFGRHVALPHCDTVRQNQPQNCSILNGMRTIGTWRACQTPVGNGRVPRSPKRPPKWPILSAVSPEKFELSTVNSLLPIPPITWDSHSWLSSPLVTRQFPRLSDGHIAILLF